MFLQSDSGLLCHQAIQENKIKDIKYNMEKAAEKPDGH